MMEKKGEQEVKKTAVRSVAIMCLPLIRGGGGETRRRKIGVRNNWLERGRGNKPQEQTTKERERDP